jgi:hypothetical protein
VEVLKALVRGFSYLYHGLLCLFLLAISGTAMATDMHSLQLDMLPWKEASLTYCVFGGALLGLGTLALAVKRILPVLFFLWSLVVVVMLVKGYVFSGYFFDSGEFRVAFGLIAGALMAAAGAWFGIERRAER